MILAKAAIIDKHRDQARETLAMPSLWLRFENRIIDPSAGSPTETLLRLLLPLSNKVNLTFQSLNELPRQGPVRNIHRIAQSVGATGGVYKGQGRNHDGLMNHHY